MKMSVMEFNTPKECRVMAKKFHTSVSDQFDSLGYDLCERFVWPSGKKLLIDRAYLNNWLKFESGGYK